MTLDRFRACTAALGLSFLWGCGDGGPPPGTLLVTSGFTDQIFVVDARTGAVMDSLSLDRRPGERDEPHAVAVSPDGRHWYATVSHGEPTLWKFETEGNRLVGRLTLPLRGAARVRLSPDGSLAAVPDYWRSGGGVPSEVALVRTHDLEVVAIAEVCPAPHDAVFDPSGRRLAVTCALGREVLELDGTTLDVVARFEVADADGAMPMNAAWTPDGSTLYATLMGRDAVVRIDPTGAEAPSFIPVSAGPAQLELANGRLVVAERHARTVTLLDPTTEQGLTVGSPGAHPHGVAVSPDGRTAWVTYEGDVEGTGGVWAVDVDTGQVLWHTPVGVFTLGVAFIPDRAPETPS